MKISIIVPTLNGAHLLQKNILPLEKELRSSDAIEIIIVDNNSTDETSNLFKMTSNFFRYYNLSKNFGFTGAINKGAREAKGDWILILNNDCKLSEKMLKKMTEFLSDNPNYVATQPVVKNQNNSVENIGYIVDLIKGKAKPVTKKENIPQQIVNQNIWTDGKVYGLSAACLLIKKSVFIDIGMFDESFHSYLEDVDLFIRLTKKNYEFAPILDSNVTHAHMSTSSKMGAYKEWRDFINWIRIIIKNYPKSFIIQHFITIFLERLRNLNGYLKKITLA